MPELFPHVPRFFPEPTAPLFRGGRYPCYVAGSNRTGFTNKVGIAGAMSSPEPPMDCQEPIDTEDRNSTYATDILSAPDQSVLLVEDERLVREVAGEILRSAGYRVWKAASSAEALRLFEQHHAEIRLLITDVVLPDDRGPQLAMKLQAAGEWVRTILISGYPERMIMKGMSDESAFFYLPKPFSAEILIRKVRQVLSLHEMSANTL